ncbi:MAG: DNA translocase FtsK [Clostridia bacterium]|nr:DNA translocase FtsK [Clostridia bacterium]
MPEEKREKAPAREKKPHAYDVPFGNQRDVTAQKADAPVAPRASADKPRQAPVRSVRNASDAPEQKETHRKSSTTATPKKPSEKRDRDEKRDRREKHDQAQPREDLPRSMRPLHRALPVILIGLAVFIGLALILNLFCLDKDPRDHWMGIVGYGICYALNGLFGPAVLALPVLLVLLGAYWRRYVDHKLAISKIVATVIFILMLGTVIHTFNMILEPDLQSGLPSSDLFFYGTKSGGGGLFGGWIAFGLYSICRFVGTFIIGFLLLAVSLFYLLGMTPQHLWSHLRNRRAARPKKKRSLSEEDAEEASNRAKMEQKIRRTTTRQMDMDDEDFETEAPVGAVRVVHAKKNHEDDIAPMPMPRLDPNDGDDLFVPEVVSEKMAQADAEEELANELATRQAAQSAAIINARRAPAPETPVRRPVSEQTPVRQPAPAASPAAPVRQPELQKPIDPASNRDAAVEPIFPKSAEGRTVRRVPRADRNFDLKNIFEDPTPGQMQRKHAPVPPEVPLSGTRPRSASPAQAPTAATRPAAVQRPAAPTAATPTRPATAQKPAAPTTSVAGTIKTPTPTAVKKPAPSATAGKPLPTNPAAAQRPAAPAPTREFGLTSEEFERLEAQQQINLPRPGEKKPAAAAPADAKKPAAPAKAAPAKQADAKPAKPQKPKRYIFPPISYLHEAEKMTAENAAEIEANKQALANTLRSFHVAIEDYIGASFGPTVTRYEITPAPGVRVRSITNLADDIALALRAPGRIRIEAPIPGTNSVGIEVPNRTRSTIYLRELIESKPFKESKNKLTACLGAGVAGEPLVFEINKMPHLLVAGTTNSGKSVCINSIIMSLLYRLTPDEVKFVMIDPKKVEFTSYQNIPHLMAPVVTAPQDAAGALQACVEEMERRYELFAQVGVRDIKGFAAATADDPDMPNLPFIVIIIDELADLMMTARDEVETAICRIAQKARAAGMHLIIGTQRPSADVVTGLIKSNVPSRIAFTVKSQVDSRVILDGIGAESLTGMGDMLFVPVGAMRNERVQGTFVSDKEVEKICEFVRATNGSAEYDTNFITKLKELASQCGNKGKGSGGGDAMPSGEDTKGDDNKYADAVRVAIEEKRVSTSLLQRKLEIGYSRAAKLIDRMQAEGYVSPPDGSKPRSVLITPEEYMEKFVDNPGGEE